MGEVRKYLSKVGGQKWRSEGVYFDFSTLTMIGLKERWRHGPHVLVHSWYSQYWPSLFQLMRQPGHLSSTYHTSIEEALCSTP
jgi:hypothetical protein